jgi:hypothetical protein
MQVEQPLVLEHGEAKITLSGMKQMLMELSPERLKELEKSLQEVVNNYCTQYIGPLPSA